MAPAWTEGQVGSPNLYFYVDTVEGAGGTVPAAAGCAMTNLFTTGQVVVFRLAGLEAANGTVLTASDVQRAFVYVPGVGRIPFTYGTHGTSSYWTAAWNTTGYASSGTVNFYAAVWSKLIPATKGSKAVRSYLGTFSQAGLAPPSRLEVNPAS